MSKRDRNFILLIIATVLLLSIGFLFRVRVSNQVRKLTKGQDYACMVTDARNSVKVALWMAIVPGEIRLTQILYNHLYCNVWKAIDVTAPHIVLITKDRAWLWSMRRMRFVEYTKGMYYKLNAIDRTAWLEKMQEIRTNK